MKILDRYILIKFIKTFLPIFMIFMFMFVLQGLWLYISDLAGKDIDGAVLGKFLLYLMPALVPNVLALSILVTGIMVFGNLAETYEFAAMKSSGISLLRAMRSLTVFILLVSVTSFYFADRVIPWGQYKSKNLRINISKMKPAMAITAGRFNEIGDDFNIKVAGKSGENGKDLEDVIIHEKTPRVMGNNKVIKAKTGELVGAEDSNVLSLILHDGNRYEERMDVPAAERRARRPFVKVNFKEYTINVDLSGINDVDADAEVVNNTHEMLGLSDLRITLDTLTQKVVDRKIEFQEDHYKQTNLPELDTGLKTEYLDASIGTDLDILTKYNAQRGKQIADVAVGNLTRFERSIKNRIEQDENDIKGLADYKIAIHKKFVIAVSCILLFFVAAPLGAIIRKGGLGLPLVSAVLLFVTYLFLGIFLENAAEEDKIPAWLGAWGSTLVFFPLAIWLTYRAATDQGFGDVGYALKRAMGIKPMETEGLPTEVAPLGHLAFDNFKKRIWQSNLASLLLLIGVLGALILNNNKGPKVVVVAGFILGAVGLVLAIRQQIIASRWYDVFYNALGFEESAKSLSPSYSAGRLTLLVAPFYALWIGSKLIGMKSWYQDKLQVNWNDRVVA